MISKCGEYKCISEYQDVKYGKNIRVFNPMKKPKHYRCSICWSTKIIIDEEDRKEEGK
jgi:hypothetical protein